MTKKNLSAAAADLIVLEKASTNRELNDEEQEAWESLTKVIFSPRPGFGERRKSFRISASLSCLLLIDNKEHAATITALSLKGIAVSADVLKNRSSEFDFILKSAFLNGEWHSLGLECRAVGFEFAKSGKIGAQFSKKNTPEIIGVYSEFVYHPAYIDYLEQLTK